MPKLPMEDVMSLPVPPEDLALILEEVMPEILAVHKQDATVALDICEDCGAMLDEEGCPSCQTYDVDTDDGVDDDRWQ